MNKIKIGIMSGFLNPVHTGHMEMIRLAREEMDLTAFILNNDKQQLLKKGKIIMDENERMDILNEFKSIDYTFLSVDEDETVVESIKKLHNKLVKSYYMEDVELEFFFINGGDRKDKKDIPEYNICRRLEIKPLFGFGEKIDSSSRVNKELGLE